MVFAVAGIKNRQPFQVFNDFEYKKFLLMSRVSNTGRAKGESNRTGFLRRVPLSSIVSVRRCVKRTKWVMSVLC